MDSLATGKALTPFAMVRHMQPSRATMMSIEAAVKSLPPAETPVAHTFAPGVYVRTMHIPAGTMLTGKVHRHEHVNILVQGDIDVMTEHGPKRLQAPKVFNSAPGIKRAGYAYTDTVWITVHQNPDNITDVDALEKEHVVDTFDAYDADAGIIEGELV